MEKIFDYVNEQSTVYDAIYDCLKKQKEKDLNFVKKTYNGGLSEEKIDQVEYDFDINMGKLNYIPELTCMDESFQKKFTSVALSIDYMNLDIGRKLDSILTFAVLINNVPETRELEDDKCYLLSTALSSLPISDYPVYGKVLSNSDLLDNIINKSEDMNERRKMIFELFDYCDTFACDDMKKEELDKLVSNFNNVVDNYKISKNKNK